MFIATTLSTVTAGLAILSGASAAPANARAAAATVGPQINCTGYQNDASYLFLTKGNTQALPGFNSTYMLSDALKAAGSSTVPSTDSQVLQNLGAFAGDAFADDDFQFGVKSFFGHIMPNNQKTCVTKTTVGGHTFFVNAECRYNDDAGQEAQYFQLKTVVDNVPYEEVSFNLTLLGHPKGSSGDKYYFKPGTAAAPAITVGTESTGYQFGLEYIHIN
ncbi:hypothetical protein HWV62_14924 [Athelia sp. TMB]|nr:hypothetical protein HWV62_14924 [Athelia sp. TMB]